MTEGPGISADGTYAIRSGRSVLTAAPRSDVLGHFQDW